MSNEDFEQTKLNYDDVEDTACKDKINKVLDSTFFNIFITIITIWALFGDDIRVITVTKTGDIIYDCITWVVFVVFLAECLLTSYSQAGYLWGFYFWLDLVSTQSLLFDTSQVNGIIFPQSDDSSGAASAAQLAKAAKASRIGTRAARVIRIIRLIRLIRIIKLYKQAEKAEQEKQEAEKARNKPQIVKERGSNYQEGEDQPIHRENSENDLGKKSGMMEDDMDASNIKGLTMVGGKAISSDMDMEDLLQETNVGKKLGAKTNKIVITLILAIMMSIPVFSVDTFLLSEDEYSGALFSLANRFSGVKITTIGAEPPDNMPNTSLTAYEFEVPAIFNAAWNNVVFHYANRRVPLLYMSAYLDVYNTIYKVKNDYGDINYASYLRSLEKQIVSYDYIAWADQEKVKYSIIAYWDKRQDAILDGILGIMRTIFVCFILASASIQMGNDAENLVITPIETMINKVKRIAKNPLEAAQIEESDALAWEELAMKDKKVVALTKEKAKFETSMLESIIVKIGALLALGFGEAGSVIIAENMAKSGGVDPMLPGQKMFAVFGFCDIRNFADVTEILQIDVMMFVNEVADIVHNIVDDYSGAPNKNIGDAFLLIWKIPNDEIRTDEEENLIMKGGPKTQAIADMSIFAFLKIIATINKSKKLAKYRDHEGLNKRMPGYRIRMGFGLHIGWGIEGAIGSKFKIDASYLSPNVNMAARLEAATKQFGVTLLISGGVYRFCSDAYKKVLRHLDRVTVKGSIQPIDFYTIDTDAESLPLDSKEKENMTGIEKRKMGVKRKSDRDTRRERIFSQKLTTSRLLDTDTDYQEMRKPFKQAFYVRWENALQLYLEGQWEMAKPILEETLNMTPGRTDGPSQTLLGVINDHNGSAPSDWKGFRELTEK